MSTAQIVAELRRAARDGWRWGRLSNDAYYTAASFTHWTEGRNNTDDMANRVLLLIVACALEATP